MPSLRVTSTITIELQLNYCQMKHFTIFFMPNIILKLLLGNLETCIRIISCVEVISFKSPIHHILSLSQINGFEESWLLKTRYSGLQNSFICSMSINALKVLGNILQVLCSRRGEDLLPGYLANGDRWGGETPGGKVHRACGKLPE